MCTWTMCICDFNSEYPNPSNHAMRLKMRDKSITGFTVVRMSLRSRPSITCAPASASFDAGAPMPVSSRKCRARQTKLTLNPKSCSLPPSRLERKAMRAYKAAIDQNFSILPKSFII